MSSRAHPRRIELCSSRELGANGWAGAEQIALGIEEVRQQGRKQNIRRDDAPSSGQRVASEKLSVSHASDQGKPFQGP